MVRRWSIVPRIPIRRQATRFSRFRVVPALDNNLYVVAPNMGTYYLFPEETTAIDTFGGRLREIDVVAPPLVPFLYPDRILRSRRRSGVGQYATSESSTSGQCVTRSASSIASASGNDRPASHAAAYASRPSWARAQVSAAARAS